MESNSRWIKGCHFEYVLKCLKENNRVGGDSDDGGNELHLFLRDKPAHSKKYITQIKVTVLRHDGPNPYLYFSNDERRRIIKEMFSSPITTEW